MKITGLSLLLFAVGSEGLSSSSSSDYSSRRDFLDTTASSSLSLIAGATSPFWIPPNSVDAATSSPRATASTLQLPPIGLGCWAWGDSLFWGYNPKEDSDLEQAFNYAVSRSDPGPVLFDTAELYGLGRSETLLGEFINKNEQAKDRAIIATKFAALPFRTKPESVVKACEGSLKRLGRPIDLYQIHFPNAFANEQYWDGLAMAYEKGLVKHVGVSNYGVDAVRACHAALAKRGIPLATNQIQHSLLYKFPEENGLLQACQDLGVSVLSYSPLALGLLTGKYNADNVGQIQGPRKKLFEKTVGTPAFDNLLASMKQVAKEHSDASLAQVAINYCRAKNTIPIPGARNLRQIQSNYQSLDWSMSSEEMKFLSQAADGLAYVHPGVNPFPQKDKDTGLRMFDS